jgi:hypothetical protein
VVNGVLDMFYRLIKLSILLLAAVLCADYFGDDIIKHVANDKDLLLSFAISFFITPWIVEELEY